MGIVERQEGDGYVDLPDNLKEFSKLKIMAVLEGDRQTWFTISVRELLARQGKPQYYMEEERVNVKEKTCQLRGWAVAQQRVAVKVFDENKTPVSCSIQMTNRVDVTEKIGRAHV